MKPTASTICGVKRTRKTWKYKPMKNILVSWQSHLFELVASLLTRDIQMGEMSKLGCLIGLVNHTIWVDSSYFLYLPLHHSSKEAGAVMAAACAVCSIQEVHTNPSTSPVTLKQAPSKLCFDVQRMKCNCILFVYNWDNGSTRTQQSSLLTLLKRQHKTVSCCAVACKLVRQGFPTYINGHKRILMLQNALHSNKLYRYRLQINWEIKKNPTKILRQLLDRNCIRLPNWVTCDGESHRRNSVTRFPWNSISPFTGRCSL
jgi:hypothetical protein